ncbi:MAG: (Fe-S)-binding protein [Flavobacteriales bacterium]|nr:(Fe-S)-binding protein [Flavobacteriales bacterium]MCB9447616.1 (Fe-S)-binding protein [Flavobacteriales bacterium]
MDVELFIPCFIDQIYPDTAANMVRILERIGCTVHYNPDQTCCGQPAFTSGHWDEAREVAAKFIKDIDNTRPVVTPSASCAGMIKNYYDDLFKNSALHNEYRQLQKNTFELSDFLVNHLKITDLGAKMDGKKATYHDSCAALREYGIKREPRILLEKVKGLELVEMKDTESCCGFGGAFAAKFEAISSSLAEVKVNNALETEADFIVSTDASCLMHLNGYIRKEKKPLKIMHLADVLVSGWD